MCPICGASCWVDKNYKGNQVPHKVLHYFSLTSRLKRLYSCRHTANEMMWHYTNRPNKEGVLHHPIYGKVWKDFDTQECPVGLAADGFNPFGNMSLS